MSINQSLAHGLDILLLFDTIHLSFMVAEMSKRLKYSQSKTYRMIQTRLGIPSGSIPSASTSWPNRALASLR
jgi:hypothetical protein